MAFDFHKNKQVYFEHQYLNSKNFILPFIEAKFPIIERMKVLEVGCAEGGVLKAFIEKGCITTGVELSEDRTELAKEFMKQDMEAGKISFINKNIYDESFKSDFKGEFDLIIFKDVIEHIHDQEKLVAYLNIFLKPHGKIFFGFPPWYMPFGGHQQMCDNKILSKLPYYHLLPMFLYKMILKMGGESEQKIANMAEIKDTGISIERFEGIVKRTGYTVVNKTHFLFNPIYRYKFKIEPRKQSPLIQIFPYFRDFFTTCVYYLIEVKK
ncbi:MAG: class I SAM-dependent methyltransferase [Bacteroidia bacterium]|nr:class I SAM-dependent methyltransferase [Bacteroidia bacterium]